MAYVMRIGGDSFEYRPLDFYWPLLAVPAAEGIVRLGAVIAGGLGRIRLLVRGGGMIATPPVWALLLFVPVLFYSSAMQGVLLFNGAETCRYSIELTEENANWLLVAPGMPMLVALSNDLRQQSTQRAVGKRSTCIGNFTIRMIQGWKPYEKMARGWLPDDILVLWTNIGVPSYYLPDLKVIDSYGLTDATIARNPVTILNHERTMAHDRQPPPGYLEERGVNIRIYPAAFSEEQALAHGNYALKIGSELWMPFDTFDHQWAIERFADRDLRISNRVTTIINQYTSQYESTVSGEMPVLRAHFDVYLRENDITYVKNPCSLTDTQTKFFLHIIPHDVQDLPDHRKPYGFDNLDFHFRFYDNGVRFNGKCIVSVDRPEYDIRHIKTGQFISGQGRKVWEGEFSVNEEEEARNDPSLGNPDGQASLVNSLPIESHLYALQQHFVALEKASATGGAIEPLGDTNTLLVVMPRGRIALVHPAGEVVYLREQVPMNQAAASDRLKTNDRVVQTAKVQNGFRVTDILLHEQSSDTFTLFVSHHYFTEDCIEFRISSTLLHLDSGHQMIFSPWQTLFIANPCMTTYATGHDPNVYFNGQEAGGQMVMDGDEHLLVVIGTHGWEGMRGGRGRWPLISDDPDTHLGKLVRIHVTTGTAEILASGLRNPQGFARDADGTLWATDHGPQGGDELNILRPSLNYGWPYVTHGIQYGSKTWPYNKVQGRHDGFEMPVYSWIPAIVPSNLIISDSQLFPLWKNDLLIASLRAQSLFRIRVHEKRVVYVEQIHIGRRIRDITQMPDGRIALLTEKNYALEIQFLKRFPVPCIKNYIYSVTHDACYIEGAGEPVIRSNYDVYINKPRLIYLRRSCSMTDIEHRFFLHITPVHLHDLPEDRKQHGFDNLDFHFKDNFSDDSFTLVNNACIVVRYLPQYDIKQIQTGQFTPETGTIWEGEFTFGSRTRPRSEETIPPSYNSFVDWLSNQWQRVYPSGSDDTPLMQDGNPSSELPGAELFAAQCASCHNLSEQHSIGPHLAAVIGRRSGRVAGYNASAALTSLDIVWTRENLAEFILNPFQFAPGTSMSAVGISPAEAQSIADFLASTQ